MRASRESSGGPRLLQLAAFSEQKRAGPLVQAGRVLVQPWALVVVGIALVEGAVILGFLTFLAQVGEGVAGRVGEVTGLDGSAPGCPSALLNTVPAGPTSPESSPG